jgi:hypothetical protein
MIVEDNRRPNQILCNKRRCFILVLTVGLLIIFVGIPRISWEPTKKLAKLQLTDDKYTRCLLDADKMLASLSLPWFITFGTALNYHRSKRFVSPDIDTGVFIDDLVQVNLTDAQLLGKFRQYGFRILSQYGRREHGQEWTLTCPRSAVRFDIFVFYPSDPKANETFAWWTASYNGLCNKMRFGKCRWRFSQFRLDTFQLRNKQFHIVPTSFLVEQYGPQWTVPKDYDYFNSLTFLPNLIKEM